tara:strand:- start:321495 stop:322688 length:1194 start_codon:yes stop_codon:yes gene_type:complete
MFYKRKKYLSFYLVLLCIATSWSQNCTQINGWLETAESYAQDVDLNGLGDTAIMKLVSPAFHNDLFKPVFKKNYADLDAGEKEVIKQQLIACASAKPYVKKGIVPGFESGNAAYSWERQIKAINNSTLAENNRIWGYEKQQRARNREKQAVARQRSPAQSRTRTRTASSRSPVRPQNPNAYNTAPENRENTPADYQKEALEMQTILKAVQNVKAPTTQFSGYKNAALLQNVYDGDFEGFPIGLKDMQEENMMGGFQKIAEVKKYERYLKQYLTSFSKNCAATNKAAFKKVVISYAIIEEEHGISSKTGETEPEVYYMRPYFEKDFRRIDKNMANANLADAIYVLAKSDEMGFDFPPDLIKLFESHKCTSPVLRKLETNLYLASKGKSSLQKLLPYLK